MSAAGKKLTGAILLVGTPSEAANLRYASGFGAVDPCVMMADGKRRWLVVPSMEKGRAKREAMSGVRVLTPQDLPITESERRRISGWALGLLRMIKKKRVTVGSFFPLGVARRLESERVRVSLCTDMLFPQRAVKTAAEILQLRRTQAAACAAMKRAVETIARTRIDSRGFLVHAGRRVTAEEVRREIDGVLLENDCIATETIVACGSVSADPHERGAGPLRAGQPIVIDIFPQSRKSGYWGDLSRTVVRGEAPAELRRMWLAVRAAQRCALKMVKPGVSGDAVHEAVKAEFERRGFTTQGGGERPQGFIHSTGHGVGLEIHEMPRIATGGERLKVGHVVTIEPGLYYPKIGGVRIEDTVVVTARGCVPLAKSAEVFEL